MWFPPRSRPARRGPARRQRPPRRGPALAVEPLEDRAVPTTWIGAPPAGIFETAVVKGTLFFAVGGPGTGGGGQLWKSDGTAEGTVLLRTFSGSVFTAGLFITPRNLTAVGGTLFFAASDEELGEELWKSDGTPGGTVLVKNIAPDTPPTPFKVSAPADSSPYDLTAVGDTLYFTADGPFTGREVWRSDGTEEGTVLVRDVNPGPASSGAGRLTPSGGAVFFTAFTPAAGYELWRTDGTGDGTYQVADVNPGPGSSLGPVEAAFLADVNGVLLFTPFTPAYGRELWRSDGTADGTYLVSDINPGAAGAFPLFGATPPALAIGGYLLFGADDGATGRELWISDGTADGTALFADLNPGPAGSDPRGLTFAGGRMYFAATTPGSGAEPWVTDFEPGGTGLLRDINPGAGDSSPSFFTAVGAAVFFRTAAAGAGQDLWVSDGTAEGTVLVGDFTAGTFLSDFTAADTGLYFVAADPSSSQLWFSDGTASGTRLVYQFSRQPREVPIGEPANR